MAQKKRKLVKTSVTTTQTPSSAVKPAEKATASSGAKEQPSKITPKPTAGDHESANSSPDDATAQVYLVSLPGIQTICLGSFQPDSFICNL